MHIHVFSTWLPLNRAIKSFRGLHSHICTSAITEAHYNTLTNGDWLK